MMRSTVVAILLALLATGARAQEKSQVVGSAPDFVATREVIYSSLPPDHDKVRHHAGWLSFGDLSERSGYFEGFGRKISYTRSQVGDRYDSLEIKSVRGRLEPSDKGRRENYLGETCTMWDFIDDTWGWRPARILFRACLTADGITMAQGEPAAIGGIIDPPSWRLTNLQRTPVSAAEGSPPADLYDWRNFSAFAGPAQQTEGKPDYVVKMVGKTYQGDGVRFRKRHYPWVLTDSTFANGARTIEIRNEQSHASLLFQADAKGVFAFLSIRKPQTLSIVPEVPFPEEVGDHRERLVVTSGIWLGEVCKVTSDSRSERERTDYRTADDIVLKEAEIGGRAPNPEDWSAVDLQRRPVDLSEVMPPAEIFKQARPPDAR